LTKTVENALACVDRQRNFLLDLAAFPRAMCLAAIARLSHVFA
jgi:hypothetical protein